MSNKIEATSQTQWATLPREWRERALDAICESGHGDIPMAAVAVIACALWEIDHG